MSTTLADRVLVVDDDVNFHRLVEAAVGPLGLECVCVSSGEEAQRELETAPPRIVLIDGLLPGVRGDELARRIRKRFDAAALPIVFVSAFFRDMKSYRLLTQECGVDVVLHKPVSVEQLALSIRRQLRLDERLRAEQAVAADIEVDLDDEPDEEPTYDSPEYVQLRSEYLATSKERGRELRAALGSLSGEGASDALHMIRVEAHRFRGSGSSFGFGEISRLGGAIEELLLANEDALARPAVLARLTGLVEALVDKIEAAAGASPIPLERTVGGKLPRVLLVDAEGPLVEAARGASDRNQPIAAASDLDEALRSAIERRPDVIFVDEASVDLEASCRRFATAAPAPVVALGSGAALADWLRATRAGAAGYVVRPPDVETLFRLGAVYARPPIGATVMVVGGDKPSLSRIAELLAPRGVAVEPCATSGEFFRSLERSQPSLVVLDGDLPEAKGAELLRVLRADLTWRTLPVIVLSEQPGPAERMAGYEAGAADWLMRPADPEELAARVLARLVQAAELAARMRRDPVTGLADRGFLLEATARALQLARREGRTLSLLGIDARLGALREAQGRLAADAALMALAGRLTGSFRTSDVVARTGGDRLVVLLHGAGRDDAERLLAVELGWIRGQRFGDFELEPAGAVASFPESTADAERLHAELERKLGKA